MKLTAFYDLVSRRTDTAKTQINVAETKRVMSEAFQVLIEMDALELTDTLTRGLALARKKRKS